MTLAKRCLFLILCCLPWAASANTALYQHAQAVGQTMSALYMQGLSEGNAKYERDLEFYKQRAGETLAVFLKNNPDQGSKLSASWGDLKGNIKTTYSQEYGWDIDSAIRRDFRSYLSNIYQLSLANVKKTASSTEQYQFALVQLESMIARFFDISSTYNGTVSLSSADLKALDPTVISTEFKALLDSLAKVSAGSATARELNSAKYKWEFIEDSVVNYTDQSAYFLVYATKNKIKKVLSSGQLQLTGNN